MTEKQGNVKQFAEGKRRLLEFIDAHPRTGWFLCTLFAVNTIINVITLILLT